MDIRSIIDAEPTTSATKPTSQIIRDEDRQETKALSQTPSTTFQSPYGAPPPVYHTSREARPPQPPPLQPPRHNDFRSPSISSYHSAQSPYQATPTSALSGAQYPFPQHPNPNPYGAHVPQYAQRDGHQGGSHQSPLNSSYSQYGQPVPSAQTPTASTPGSSQTYYIQGRPPSSNSATTPTSAQPQAPNFPRQSPSSSHVQVRGPTQSFSSQQYLSQPNTPLGPPANFTKSGASVRRESPGSYGHSRQHSGGSYTYNSISVPSPSTEHPGSAFNSPSTVGHRQGPSSVQRQSVSLDRERSLSVSPKTRLPSQPSIDVSKPIMDHYHSQRDLQNNSRRDSEHYRMESQDRYSQSAIATPSRSFSLGVNGILNAPSANEYNKQTKESTGNVVTTSPQVITPPNQPPSYTRTSSQSDSQTMPGSESSEMTPNQHHSIIRQSVPIEQTFHIHSGPSPMAPISDRPRLDSSAGQAIVVQPTYEMPAPAGSKLPHQKAEHHKPPVSDVQEKSPLYHKTEEKAAPIISVPPSANKRRREDGIPVYAQSSRKGPSKNPYILGKPPVKASPLTKPAPSMGSSTGQVSTQPPGPETNGLSVAGNDVRVPISKPPPPGSGALAPWEHSIMNYIPHEEMTKRISDFLFTEVVMRDDVGVVSNKGVHSQPAVLEIEAKLGHLIDNHTNARLRLPVSSECILDRSGHGLNVRFESSMTESQHRSFNGFLNNALVDSKPPKAHNRVQMDYAHTYETDTFYTLSQNGILSLPNSIQNQFGRNRMKQRIRVTKNSKTGRPIAQIIKVRVADIEIYSPHTMFDWRVSVNVEMNIDGDFERLIEPGDHGQGDLPRSKDRLSYKHLQYQIDLTQVTKKDPATNQVTDKIHELEIEVASQEVRNQGHLARRGEVNQYEDLIKGLVDNVRILARHCKSE